VIRYKCQNEEATKQFGEAFASILEPGDLIGLDGDLGAGKTFISKAIIKSLGIEEYVTSPSYTIVNEYHGDKKIYHFDVYRIDDIDEMYEIGYEEYFFSDGICLVEWSSMIEELLPEAHYRMNLSMGSDFNERVIEIKGSNPALEAKLEVFYDNFRH